MSPNHGTARWELYKLLGEPLRLRLLALSHAEELSIGELAELSGERQPSVSRHVSQLRRAGLLLLRKQGTRAFVRLAPGAAEDPVVADGLAAGEALCAREGSLDRIPELLRRRDAASRELFQHASSQHASGRRSVREVASELPAYLRAFALLLPERGLAIDVGCGDGALLDVLAPIYERVLAFDRSAAQIARARERVAARGYRNVELEVADLDEAAPRERAGALGGADAVFAARVLHHVPQPRAALRALSALARPGGALVLLDYLEHEDERLYEQQADHWLGFSPEELAGHARAVGLLDPRHASVPASLCGDGPDGHLPWQVLVARVSGELSVLKSVLKKA